VTVTAAAERAAIVGGIAGFAERSLINNCTAVVNMTVTGHAHNSSAGGIVGTMLDYTTVRNCAASGTVTLNGTGADSEGAGLMVYAGGVVGYSGNGETNGKASGCLIMRSQWTGGTVSASSGYPYAGGVVGYNYSGARTAQCSSAGTVTATGENLPYAGGVAGYNSGYVTDNPGTVSLIDNCYSAATVTAVSTSKAALAGGIAGANALRAYISKCYARGEVTATVAGNGDNIGGSAGVMIAANAGGIAGAQYFENNPVIQYCAALNSSVTGAETPGSSGVAWNVYRIAGAGDGTHNTGVFDNNIAYSGMTGDHLATDNKAGNTKNGADNAAAKPAQEVFTGMGWDFNGVWQMAADGWPGLR
jgi:hypothetical protein